MRPDNFHFYYNFLQFSTHSKEEGEEEVAQLCKTPSIMENHVAFMSWRDALQRFEYELWRVSWTFSSFACAYSAVWWSWNWREKSSCGEAWNFQLCTLHNNASEKQTSCSEYRCCFAAIILSLEWTRPSEVLPGVKREKQLKDSFNWDFLHITYIIFFLFHLKNN